MSNNEEIKFESVNEVLEFAIEKEQEAYEFYNDWASRVESEAISEVLREFAGEELKHKKLIENVREGKTIMHPKEKVPDLKLTDYFLPPEPTTSTDFQNALLVAIKKEEGSVKMYNYLASIQENDELKELFETLESEEKRHKLKLESIYDDNFMKEI